MVFCFRPFLYIDLEQLILLWQKDRSCWITQHQELPTSPLAKVALSLTTGFCALSPPYLIPFYGWTPLLFPSSQTKEVRCIILLHPNVFSRGSAESSLNPGYRGVIQVVLFRWPEVVTLWDLLCHSF